MAFPLIFSGGTLVKRYIINDDKVVFVENPDSIGPIKYKYICLVFEGDAEEPALTITAEQNEMQRELSDTDDPDLEEAPVDVEESDYFLCFFENGNHSNLGNSVDISKFPNFEVAVFEILKSKRNYSDGTKVRVDYPPPTSQGIPTRSKIYNTVRTVMLVALVVMLGYAFYLVNVRGY